MKISVFRNGYIAINEDHGYTEPVTVDGVTTPAVGHPDCIYVTDREYDEKTQTIAWDNENQEIIIINNPVYEKTPTQINIESGEIITQEVYDGNPYAQIADLAKAQVTTLALLVPILGKEVVAGAYVDLIVTVKKVSEARVKEGLSPYDLSFLE